MPCTSVREPAPGTIGPASGDYWLAFKGPNFICLDIPQLVAASFTEPVDVVRAEGLVEAIARALGEEAP